MASTLSTCRTRSPTNGSRPPRPPSPSELPTPTLTPTLTPNPDPDRVPNSHQTDFSKGDERDNLTMKADVKANVAKAEVQPPS